MTIKLGCPLAVVAAACGRINFDRTGPLDMSVDGSATSTGQRWVTTAEVHGAQHVFVTRSLDPTGFGAACPEITADRGYRVMLGHPSLPYVYAMGDQLDGVALGCQADVQTAVPVVGATAVPLPRVALDAASAVGFFTLAGPLNAGIYRFAVSPAGTPSGATSADVPLASNALLIDPPDRVYVAGPRHITQFTLQPGMQLPSSYSSDASLACSAPVDLLISGIDILVFCADRDEVDVYVTNILQLGIVAVAGTPGAVDQVAKLPGDRAIAAHIAPPGLVVFELGGGQTLTWTQGPTFGTRATALAASSDGMVVVAARSLDAATSEISAWSVAGDQLVPLGVTTVGAMVTSIAVTARP